MAMYKTPDVYVEEIATIPSSVTPVETAIPVFIGYTEFALGGEQEDLTGTPVRITSFVDYVRRFGTEPIEDVGIRVERRVTMTVKIDPPRRDHVVIPVAFGIEQKNTFTPRDNWMRRRKVSSGLRIRRPNVFFLEIEQCIGF